MARRKATPAPAGAPVVGTVERTAFDWTQPVALRDELRMFVPVRLTADAECAGQRLTAGMLLAVTEPTAAQLVDHFAVGVREGQG